MLHKNCATLRKIDGFYSLLFKKLFIEMNRSESSGQVSLHLYMSVFVALGMIQIILIVNRWTAILAF